MSPTAPKKSSIAIDIHAHMMLPEVYAVTVGHSAFGKSTNDPTLGPVGRKKAKERSDFVCAKMADTSERHLKSIERACPDVAEDDTKGGQCQEPWTAGMLKVFRVVEHGLRMLEAETRDGAIDQAAHRWTSRIGIHLVRMQTACRIGA